MVVVTIGFFLFSMLAGCAASESALQTVTKKTRELRQKMSDVLAPDEEPAPATQEKSAASPPPKKAPAATGCKKPPSPIQKKAISPGYTYCKSPRNSFYQAYLSEEWNNSAFKFISIDGLRYSRGFILNYVYDPNNDTVFFLKEGVGLGVELNKHFDLEIAFYPPDKKDHQEFKPFKVIVINRDDEVTQSEEITSRMKNFRITR